MLQVTITYFMAYNCFDAVIMICGALVVYGATDSIIKKKINDMLSVLYITG